MVAPKRPAVTALAVCVAARVSTATVVSGGRVVGVDATCQGVCSGCPVREGGGVLSYEKVITGSFFVWRFLQRLLRNPARLVTRSPRRLRSCRSGASDRDMVATLLTPILGSLLREYSGLRVCSSETSQQRQGARRAEETGR
ncbi:hypothetical protein Taro_014632 [Colocasia esculenta]|uniref:Secreted protein n=1 Tax=Colocasia esculenta TaxID=4460 RepID=A0A843UF37_COLES|nr:hypothetical protein [Colocasia esculenta]